MFVVLEEIRHACINLSIFSKTYYQRLKLDIFFSLDATYRPPGLSMQTVKTQLEMWTEATI